jgi:hypothetical protein
MPRVCLSLVEWVGDRLTEHVGERHGLKFPCP